MCQRHPRVVTCVAWLFLCTVCTSASWGAPYRTAADRPVDMRHIQLDLAIDIPGKTISGKAILIFRPLRELTTLELNAVGFEVAEVRHVSQDGSAMAPLEFINTGQKLLLTFPQVLNKGEEHHVLVRYAVRKPKSGLHFFSPSKDEPQIAEMVWSQGETTDNRYWFPCLDHPNERQSTELIATVPRGMEVLSNGRLVSRQVSSDGKSERFHWLQERSHVAYLVTLVAGRFTIHRETWRNRPVLFYVPLEYKHDAETVQATFALTRNILEFFSENFAIEYPCEKYAQLVVEQFTAGGMENTSATTLYDAVMHDPRSLADSDPDWLISHELGHQWWGDLVTCKDWAHLWLNEGFATYCEVLRAEHSGGADERDYRLYQKSASARSGAAQSRPIIDRHYPNPGSMFDTRAYPKGGWVLHMLRRELGDEDFFRGLQRYGTAYAFRTAESADFRQSLEESTGRTLERFFYDWTERPGSPVLEVSTDYKADDKLVRIALKQTQKEDQFEIPVMVELQFQSAAGTTQSPITIERRMTEKELVLYVPSAHRPSNVRIDPQFSILAEIKEKKSRDLWVAQLSATNTVPEQLRAIKHFADSKTDADRELLEQVLAGERFYGVQIAAAEGLGKSGEDLSRDLLLKHLNHSEPRVRRAVVVALGKFARDQKVAQALAERWKAGDSSQAVTASLIGSWSAVTEEIPWDVIAAALAQESHGQAIRSAAAKAVARSNDERALATLLELTQPENHRTVRITAIESLPTWLLLKEHSAAQRKQSVDRLTELCQQGRPRVRREAVEALGRLGKWSEPSRGVLVSIAEQDVDSRVRERAAEAIKQLSEQAAPDDEATEEPGASP